MEAKKAKTIEYYILSKSLREGLTDEEQVLLRNWLAADKSHAAYYQAMRHRRLSHAPQRKNRTAEAFRKFRQLHPLHRSISGVSRRIIWLAGTAAVLLLILGIGFIHRTAAPTPVKAGSYMALLTTNHGESMKLENTTQEVSLTGVEHLVQDNAMLDYTEVVSADENHTLSIPRGREFRMKLNDGTVVDINAQSTLTYPVKMNGKERRVKLAGEAYFDVAKDSVRPFIVEVGAMEIHVTGTSFNVRAYEEETSVYTTLERGSVEISVMGQTLNLSPGQQARLTQEGKLLKKDVDTELYTAWRKGYFIFENTTLKEVLGSVSRWYDISVAFEDTALENIRIDGTLDRYSNLNELLEKIEKLDIVRFETGLHRILVKRGQEKDRRS